MQARLWIGTVALLLLAVVSGVADWRRRRRRDPDRVGWVPWPTVQMLALLAALILASLAFNGQ